MARYWLLSLLLVCGTAYADEDADPRPGDPLPGRPTGAREDPLSLAPKIRGKELVAKSKAAIQSGFQHLAKTQNSDGSWGSHDPALTNLKNFGFGTANRGSQDGVRSACTAICALAYLRMAERTKAQEAVYQKALEALLSTDRFAYEKGEAFNTWGYGYKLLFLAEFLERTKDEKLRARAKKAAAVCVRGLKRFQLVDGGWNYYAGPLLGGESMSFNTGNFIVALTRAKKQGVDVPQGMIGDAVKLVKRMRTVRGGFVYDARFLLHAGSVNELSAAARAAACEEGLAAAGVSSRKHIDRTRLVWAEGENWLEDGRKLITPHSAIHQISGYFFFYGYYWFAELLQRVDDVTQKRWERMAWTMVRTQETSGEWWDTAAATYGDKWGTGFAILVLQRSIDALEKLGADTKPLQDALDKATDKKADAADKKADAADKKADEPDKVGADKPEPAAEEDK